MRNNILITTSSFAEKEFNKNLNVINNPYHRKLSEEEILNLIIKYQPIGIIAGVEPLTRKVLESAKELKVISRCGIGLDSIDLKAAKELGIKIVNTKDAPTNAVAELTIGLMLAVLRNIPSLDKGIRDNKWKGPKGMLLGNKVIGIIGCGRIGSRVAYLCKAFGCKVIGYDPNIQSHPIINMTTIDKVLINSDIVTLHIPLNNETKEIISEQNISIMKKNAILVNVARGGLVNEISLYNALVKGDLFGAALDCFINEPYIGKLTTLNNVVLSPHMGSSTITTRTIMEKQALENLMIELKIFI